MTNATLQGLRLMAETVTDNLEVGDLVKWRGAWGSQPSAQARVTRIEICAPGAKEGRPATRVPWTLAQASREEQHITVDLDNGHWAYGQQLEKVAA